MISPAVGYGAMHQHFIIDKLPALIPPLLRKGDTPAEARACLWGQECPQLERRDKSGYATILTGSKLQWGLQSPSEAKTQLNLVKARFIRDRQTFCHA